MFFAHARYFSELLMFAFSMPFVSSRLAMGVLLILRFSLDLSSSFGHVWYGFGAPISLDQPGKSS